MRPFGFHCSVLEQILTIEVRSVAIRRSDGVEDDQFLRPVPLIQTWSAKGAARRDHRVCVEAR